MAVMIAMIFFRMVFHGLYYPCTQLINLWAAPKVFTLPPLRKPPEEKQSLNSARSPLPDDLLYLCCNTIKPHSLMATTIRNMDTFSDLELENLSSIIVQMPQCLHAKERFNIIFDSGMTVSVSFDQNDFVTF